MRDDGDHPGAADRADRRRGGFWTGAALGVSSRVVASIAGVGRLDPLFCPAHYDQRSNGFVQYRFAAARLAEEGFRAKAISWSLPAVCLRCIRTETAKWSRDLFAPVLIAGCFAIVVAATRRRDPARCPLPPPPPRGVSWQRLAATADRRAKLFVVALLCGMVGMGDVAGDGRDADRDAFSCGYGFTDAAFVIQWHILGMYGPSFFTGYLIARFGLTPVLLTGAALLLACCGINLAGIAEGNFWAANLILGIGWNFLFIGGTTLLTCTYAPAERAKVQALNDFTIFGTSTLSSFSSGALLAGFGWTIVQMSVMPFVAVAAAAILWMWGTAPRAAPSYAAD